MQDGSFPKLEVPNMDLRIPRSVIPKPHNPRAPKQPLQTWPHERALEERDSTSEMLHSNIQSSRNGSWDDTSQRVQVPDI